MLKIQQLLIAAGISLYASPALGQVGQVGNDGYFYIKDNISPRTRYQVELAGTPTTRAILANPCGMIVLRPSAQKPFSNGERFELTDTTAQKTYALANTSLPVKTSPKCQNGQLETSDVPAIWKTAEGAIAIRNLTPNGAISLKRLDQNSQRTITSNACGFLRIKLPSPIPAAILLNGMAFPTTGEASVPGVQCKKGVLYERYPRPAVIAGIPQDSWKQQNLTAGTPGAIVIQPTPTPTPAPSPTPTPTPTPSPTPTPTPAPSPSPTPTPSPSPSPQPTAQYVYVPAPPPGKSSCTSESGTSVSFSGLQPNQQYTAYDTEADVVDTQTANSQGVVVFGFSQDVRELTWEGEPDQIEIVAGDDNSIGNDSVRRIGVTSMATCTMYPINQEGQIIKINPDGSVEVVKI